IACANVASLLVAQAAQREREFAIRAALGAGRARLVRQLLAESLVLSILGAAAGLLVPAFGLRLLMHAAPLQSVEAVEVHIDASVLAFTTGLALLTGVAFGLAPALAAARSNLTEGLKSGTVHAGHLPYRTRLRQGLVVAELAAALVLLTGAGLLTRSLFQLWAVDSGGEVNVNAVSAGYFKTVGASVTAGRDFVSLDHADGAPVAIVNGAFAREFLRGANPVEHRVAIAGASRTIVGQIKDIRQLARDVPAAPEAFIPALQAGY